MRHLSIPLFLTVISSCAAGPGAPFSASPGASTSNGSGEGEGQGTSCTFEDLAPPATPCVEGGDGSYRGVCAVDCFGNVYPAHSSGSLPVLPGSRFYAVVFSPRPDVPLRPALHIGAYVGSNNVKHNSDCCAEMHISNGVPAKPSITRDGDLFVKIDQRIDGPSQLVVRQTYSPVEGYVYRTYVGGVPPLQ